MPKSKTKQPLTPTVEPLAVKPEEAALIIGRSRTAVYGLIRDGKLESIKDGKSRTIPLAALRRYVERMTPKTDKRKTRLDGQKAVRG